MRKVKMLIAAVVMAVMLSGCEMTDRGIEIPIGNGWYQGYGPHGGYSYHRYYDDTQYGGPICPVNPAHPGESVWYF